MDHDRCERCRHFDGGFCHQTGETTKPEWSCEDFMGHICMECGWDIRTHDVLSRLYKEMCPTDSFGVPGSEFQLCRLCGTGGAPLAEWEHANDCPMREVEDLLFGLGKYET